jgi:hypothetical protein
MIVCVTSARSSGCTFLEWSLHWLSGQDQYYLVDGDKLEPLITNPIAVGGDNKVTAHQHTKNHPRGLIQTQKTITALQSQPSNGLYSFYPIANETDYWCLQLRLDASNLRSDHWQSIFHAQQQELISIGNLCYQHNIKTVYLTESPETIPYYIATRHVPPWTNSISEIEYVKLLTGITQDLPVWDLRERLALSLRPIAESPFCDYINPHQAHFRISNQSLWYDGIYTVPKILDWLNLNLVDSRFAQWQEIYHHWQQSQLDYARMTWQLPAIVDAIVHNHYYLIPPMTLVYEAAVQHCLIYQHGLNLKTWNLQQFPSNTQDLHKLLEPNFHNIT